MIIINDKKIHVNANQAADILGEHTKRGGVFLDLDRICAYVVKYTEELRPVVERARRILKDPYLNFNAGKDLREALLKIGVPDSRLKKDGEPSVAAPVLKALVDAPDMNEEIKSLIEDLLFISKRMKGISMFKSYLVLPLCKVESFEGHRMVLAKCGWETLNTGRISATNPGLQTVARDTADVITYPSNYILIRADSGQIEPRITYSFYIKDPLLKKLIMVYDDAYWGMLDFILMSKERESDLRRDLSLVQQIELPSEGRRDLKVLLLAGNYGGALQGFDPALAAGFIDKIQKHPARLKLEEEVKDYVRRGGETFYTYFGSKITPQETPKYKRHLSTWTNHVVRCGINNPIQGTAGDLMCESVYRTDKLMKEECSSKSWIGYYKHDESGLYLHERDAHLKYDLADMVSYQVEDGIPIKGDYCEGLKTGTLEM